VPSSEGFENEETSEDEFDRGDLDVILLLELLLKGYLY